MRHLSGILAIVLVGTCLPRPLPVWAAEEVTESLAARRAIQQQLHHRLPAIRIEAYRRLKGFTPLEAAKLIVPSGLSDRQAEVRRAAYETLLVFRNEEDVAHLLLKSLEKQARIQPDASIAAPLIAVLLASDSQQIGDELRGLLDNWQAKSKTGSTALIAVADELGAQGGRQSLTSLQKLTQLRYFSNLFAFRRAVVQAMTHVEEPEAVGALIRLLPATDGEVRGDIVRYLCKVTGQAQDLRLDDWRAWWKKHKDDFQLPAAMAAGPMPAAPQNAANGLKPAKPLQELVAGGAPAYYGLSIHARRMVFVLDVSGSMTGMRIMAAKRELINAIQALPEDSAFSIVAFNHMVNAWQSNLVKANAANKQAAVRFVASLVADGKTAAYEALQTALRFDVEAIYFLTDGAPTTGRILAPPAIVAAVGQINRTRRISIYVIGIAPGLEGDILDQFLRTLAEENYGIYRRVD